LIQKFFDYGLPDHQSQLLAIILDNTVELSFDTYGCRVIQKALEIVTVEEKHFMLDKLHPNLENCMRDTNANHVIQKLVEVLSFDKLKFIVEVLMHKTFLW
jgi:hypothetical protein